MYFASLNKRMNLMILFFVVCQASKLCNVIVAKSVKSMSSSKAYDAVYNKEDERMVLRPYIKSFPEVKYTDPGPKNICKPIMCSVECMRSTCFYNCPCETDTIISNSLRADTQVMRKQASDDCFIESCDYSCYQYRCYLKCPCYLKNQNSYYFNNYRNQGVMPSSGQGKKKSKCTSDDC